MATPTHDHIANTMQRLQDVLAKINDYDTELAAQVEHDMTEWMASEERIYLSATFSRDLVNFRKNHPIEDRDNDHVSHDDWTKMLAAEDAFFETDWADCTGMDETMIPGLS